MTMAVAAEQEGELFVSQAGSEVARAEANACPSSRAPWGQLVMWPHSRSVL